MGNSVPWTILFQQSITALQSLASVYLHHERLLKEGKGFIVLGKYSDKKHS